MNESREKTGWIIIAGMLALLLWLLSRAGRGFLHESVTHVIKTPQGTIVSDSRTGFPQFDIDDPESYDSAKLAAAIAPIDGNGNITQFPSDPMAATCPVGYQKWRGVADDSVWCLPA